MVVLMREVVAVMRRGCGCTDWDGLGAMLRAVACTTSWCQLHRIKCLESTTGPDRDRATVLRHCTLSSHVPGPACVGSCSPKGPRTQTALVLSYTFLIRQSSQPFHHHVVRRFGCDCCIRTQFLVSVEAQSSSTSSFGGTQQVCFLEAQSCCTSRRMHGPGLNVAV